MVMFAATVRELSPAESMQTRNFCSCGCSSCLSTSEVQMRPAKDSFKDVEPNQGSLVQIHSCKTVALLLCLPASGALCANQ